MNKFFSFLLIIITASILGGIYGIIHDQITFTISEEYYTKFKFIQFKLDYYWGLGEQVGSPSLPELSLQNPRFGAVIVGTLATWWVGLIIGIILGLVGLIHKNGKLMFSVTLKAIILTTGIALTTGLFGLVYGYIFLIDNPPNWYIPNHVLNRQLFIMVGSMHNFSYLGGFIGLIFGVRYSLKRKIKKEPVLH